MKYKEHKEHLKLIPFLWLLLSLIAGVILGWWGFLLSPFLFYRSVRIYICVALFGVGASQILHKETKVLEPDKFYMATCVINSQLQKDLYSVTVLSCYAEDDSGNCGGFNAAFEVDRELTGVINRSDTVEFRAYVETLELTKRDRSTANRLINDGLLQMLINDPELDIRISRFNPSSVNIEIVRIAVKKRLSELLEYSENALVLDQMILGDKNPDSKKETSIFRRAGIAHVLAISGLHIGIIFMVISSMLFFMNYVFQLRALKLILTIILIFVYIWLIDFHPSAVRAAVMFSLLSVCSFMTTSIVARWNILFGTAFMMILFDTTLIYNLSFQLSFVAVGAIMYSLMKFRDVLKSQNEIVKYFLLSIIIALSAQLATLPLTLYYFGEFSLVSLITNVIIAPLIAPLIILALLYIALGVDFIGQLTIYILDAIVYIANGLIELPYAYFQDIDFSKGEMWLMYIVYVLFLICVELKNKEKTLSLH